VNHLTQGRDAVLGREVVVAVAPSGNPVHQHADRPDVVRGRQWFAEQRRRIHKGQAVCARLAGVAQSGCEKVVQVRVGELRAVWVKQDVARFHGAVRDAGAVQCGQRAGGIAHRSHL
jgi:hypothetical protein